jgi:hypothetical protein
MLIFIREKIEGEEVLYMRPGADGGIERKNDLCILDFTGGCWTEDVRITNTASRVQTLS